MIATASDVKMLLEIEASTYDAMLEELLAGISRRFAGYCNRVLERQAERVEIHDGGQQVISLAAYPVEGIASIRESLDHDFAAAEALVEDGDYWCHKPSGLIWRESALWLGGPGAVQVVYTGGYLPAGQTPEAGQTAMPEDLQRAAQLQCRFEFLRRNELGLLDAGTQSPDIRIFSAMDLLPEVREILSLYRRDSSA